MDGRRNRRRLPWVVALLLAACGRVEPIGAGDAASPGTSPRIVSLSPAISRTLVDLGLEGYLVGRSTYCTSVDPELPVCGDLLHVDFERLTRLHPTHVLVQPPAGGVDPALAELAAAQGWTLGRWRLDDVDDIDQLILDLPATIFDADDGRLADSASRAATLSSRLASALSPGPTPPWRGRVLLVSGAEPVLAFGRDTYLHDVLRSLGAQNAASTSGWAALSLEDVVRLDPDAIVLVTTDDEAEASAERLDVFRSLEVEATRHGRLAVLAHPDALTPSSAVIEVAGRLREILEGLDGPAS